jgi:holliday junction DNA helicase RuvB
MKRTSRGREATEKAYKHLKIAIPGGRGAGLFDV